MSSGNVMEREGEVQGGVRGKGALSMGDGPEGELRSKGSEETRYEKTGSNINSQEIVSTPVKAGEMRRVGGRAALELRSGQHGLYAPGPQTFDHKYMPFAAGLLF